MEQYMCGKSFMQQAEVSFTVRSRRCSCSGPKYELEWRNLLDERWRKFQTVSYRWVVRTWWKWILNGVKHPVKIFWLSGAGGGFERRLFWAKEECCQMLDQDGSPYEGSGWGQPHHEEEEVLLLRSQIWVGMAESYEDGGAHFMEVNFKWC